MVEQQKNNFMQQHVWNYLYILLPNVQVPNFVYSVCFDTRFSSHIFAFSFWNYI
jgi:hypothetical protein